MGTVRWGCEMSRYIDADELVMAFGEVRADYNCFNELERPRYEMWSNAIDFINTIAKSSIDIVRCKECKYYIDNMPEDSTDDECRWRSEEQPNPDDFCSYGERKSDE